MDSALQKFKKLSTEIETIHKVLNWFRYIFLIMAIASNLVVCFVMMKTKHRRKTLSKFFIFHLAKTDIAFRILEVYELITERASHGELSSTHCKIIVFFQYVCAAVLFSLLAGIALERSKNIIHPLESIKGRYHHRRKRTVAFIWLYALSISATFLYSATSITFTRHFHSTRNNSTQGFANSTDGFSDNITFKSPKTHCVAGPRVSLQSQVSFTIYFVGGFFVPLCTMATCYIRVFCFLSNRAKNSMLNRSVVRSKRKTVFVLLLLVLSFLISWGPIMMLELIESFFLLGKEAQPWVRPVAEVFCLSSSILNPFIYAFGNTAFRKHAINLLSCNRKLNCY